MTAPRIAPSTAAPIVLAALSLFLGGAEASENFRATLGGDAEVPPVMTDTSGAFQFRYDAFDASATYRLRVRDGERITQAHLHCAPAGVNGPVIVFLAGFHANGWDIDGNWIDNATVTDANVVNSACGATLEEIVESMRNGNVYVNVHSIAYPGGVVRGQVK